MILRDCIDIELPPEPVWEMLRYAEYMELWNPKCVSCPSLGRELRQGDRFVATFKMSREQVTDVEVRALEPFQRLALRHFPREMGGHVDEIYTLEVRKNGRATRVRQVVDMRQAGFPKWVVPIIWLINVLGRKKGIGPLEGLRDAAIAQAKLGDA